MLNFLALGDWGRMGTAAQHQIARQMGRVAQFIDADFIVSTGDNFYDAGVESIHDEHWKTSFKDVYTAHPLDISWYSVLGNHDYRGNVQAQIDYTSINPRWCMPSQYFTVVHDLTARHQVRFIYLDTTPFLEEYRQPTNQPYITEHEAAEAEDQCRWLENTLARSEASWHIVVGHHPIFSSSPLHGDSRELKRRVLPILEQYDVQAYICGHDHNLQHLKPEGDLHYFISGAASEIRETSDREMNCFAEECCGFLAASLTEDYLHVRFFDDSGTAIHTTLIERENPSKHLTLDLSRQVRQSRNGLPKKWSKLQTVT